MTSVYGLFASLLFVTLLVTDKSYNMLQFHNQLQLLNCRNKRNPSRLLEWVLLFTDIFFKNIGCCI